MRNALVGVVLALLVGACGPASSPATGAVVVSAAPSPDRLLASLAAEQARWAGRHPATFAFTLNHMDPGGVGPDWRYRITSLDGASQAAWLDGATLSGADLAQLTIEGLFERAHQALDAGGDLQVGYDPTLGYPTQIAYAKPSVSDGDWTETVTSFVAGPDTAQAAHERKVLRSARLNWKRWEPTAYEYVWRRFDAPAGPASGTAWRFVWANGRSSTSADPSSDGALPATAATVEATFDAADAALDVGAWVDLSVDPVSGLPLLLAVDPTTTTGRDPYWIRLMFTDTQRVVATQALQDALERWAAAGLQHFSYTWRYRGELDPLTYGVKWDGDRSALTRSPGTPVPEARSYATPRIDDTFQLIQQVLAQGGHVTASYDPALGYPTRVEVDPAGDAGARGTITISGFDIR